VTELVKNLNDKSKDLYFDKLQEIKARISANRLYICLTYISIFYMLFDSINILSDGNDEETENIKRNRGMSITYPFFYSKGIQKVLKLPAFSNGTFYPLTCIETLSKELEVIKILKYSNLMQILK